MNNQLNTCPSWRSGTAPNSADAVGNANGYSWTVTGDQTVADNCYVYQPWQGYTYWWPSYENRKTQAFHIAMALDKEGLVRSDTKKGFIDLVVAIERML